MKDQTSSKSPSPTPNDTFNEDFPEIAISKQDRLVRSEEGLSIKHCSRSLRNFQFSSMALVVRLVD